MVMDEGVRALVVDPGGVADEIKADRARIGALEELTPWSGTDRQHSYNPLVHVYNGTQSALRRTRMAIMRAVNGTGRYSLLCAGDSSLVGVGGVVGPTVDRFSIPKQIALILSQMTGAAQDTGFTAVPQALNTISDRVTTTGTAPTMNGPFVSIPSAGTWTYETEDAGDEVVIMYTGLSSAWTYSIDDKTPVAVAAGPGTNTYHTLVTSGHGDTTHKITLDPTGAGGTFLFVVALWVRKSAGISVHNIAYGGSRAAHGPANNSWTTNLGTTTALSSVRAGMRAALDLDPDTCLWSIGPNDLFQGDTAANALTGLETMMGWYPNADHVILSGIFFPGTDTDKIAEYTAGRYALADEYDAVLVDTRDLFWDFGTPDGMGLIGADDAHFVYGADRELARALATILGGGGGFANPSAPQTLVHQSGTAYTFKESDNGKRIRFSNAAAIAATLPSSLSSRWECEWEVYGAGQVTFSASGGGTLRSRGAATKSAGQYAVGGVSRIDGDELLLYGDITT